MICVLYCCTVSSPGPFTDGIGYGTYLHEDGRLSRQLLADVLARHEDGFQVHPLLLHRQDQVYGLGHAVQRFLPAVDLLREGVVELGGLDGG